MLADKAKILAQKTQRARVVWPNNNVVEGRIGSAKNNVSASPMHEFKRGVVVKKHGSNFSIGYIFLPIYDRDVSGENPDLLHTIAFHLKCENVCSAEKLRRHRYDFLRTFYCLLRNTCRNASQDWNPRCHIDSQFQTACLAREEGNHSLFGHQPEVRPD